MEGGVTTNALVVVTQEKISNKHLKQFIVLGMLQCWICCTLGSYDRGAAAVNERTPLCDVFSHALLDSFLYRWTDVLFENELFLRRKPVEKLCIDIFKKSQINVFVCLFAAIEMEAFLISSLQRPWRVLLLRALMAMAATAIHV